MKRSSPPVSVHAQVEKRHCTMVCNPNSPPQTVGARALRHDNDTRVTPTRPPHEVGSALSIKETKHQPLKHETEPSPSTTQAPTKDMACGTVTNMKPPAASLSRLQVDLESFRSEQSARALALGAAASSTKVCEICMEQVSRDRSHPRQHCFFLCGHSACSECCSRILASKNAVCPWCRFLLDDTSLVKKEGNLPAIHDDGTFTVHVQDRKATSLDIPCCWSTTLGEILDLVAPLRVREFVDLQFPRKNLQLGLKLNSGYLELHEGHTLNDIGYAEGYQLRVNQRRLPADDSIIAARLEHSLDKQFYPDGKFTLKVICLYKLRPEYNLDGVNKFMKLSEIGCMIKAKLKQDGFDGCYFGGVEPKSLDVWGSVDRGIWDQRATSLDALKGQGHGKKGRVYYD